MTKLFFRVVTALGLVVGMVAALAVDYPKVPMGSVVEDHFGVKVSDPYRSLEDLDSPTTRAFVIAESNLTNDYINSLKVRGDFKDRLKNLVNYEKVGIPFEGGGHIFYSHNDGLQNQSILMMANRYGDTPEVALDPNLLSADGHLAVVGYVLSHNGKLLAYGVSDSGSDWTDWHIRDLTTHQDRPDVLRFSKYYEPVFTPDDKGLYYSAFPAPAKGQELAQQDLNNAVRYHLLGSSDSADKVVFKIGPNDWQFIPKLSSNGNWLVLTAGEGEVGDKGLENVYLINTANPERIKVLSEGFKASFELVGSNNDDLYFLTTLNAPNGRVVKINAATAEPQALDHALTVIKESDNAISITEPSVAIVGSQILVRSLHDAHTEVSAYNLSGQLIRKVNLPGVGVAKGFAGQNSDSATYFSFSNLITPPTVFRYDVKIGHISKIASPKVNFNSSEFEQHLVFFEGKDGTRIPMTLAYKKNLKLDGARPVILYGYGGFAIATLPAFNASRIAWLEKGGIYAMAHIRGGGEYGERWHRQAYRDHKQVVFDDFISAGEWLIKKHYTDSKHLAIQGGSNGGLLIGACVTQRPDLFGAAVAQVGVLDMLRFHLFGQGAGWTGEYGHPDSEADFKTLIKYSPYHNVKSGTRYPATLVVTGDHDTRVMPMHSFKFAAALQAAQAADNPVYLMIESASGHGGGPTVTQSIDQTSAIYSFVWDQLNKQH